MPNLRIQQWHPLGIAFDGSLFDHPPEVDVKSPLPVCLSGYIHNHPTVSPARLSTTSPIIGRAGPYIRTASGSSYLLGNPSFVYEVRHPNAARRLRTSLPAIPAEREDTSTLLPTTVAGIPCFARAQYLPPEPEVGISFPTWDDLCLFDRKGYRAHWLERKLTPSEEHEICRKLSASRHATLSDLATESRFSRSALQ